MTQKCQKVTQLWSSFHALNEDLWCVFLICSFVYLKVLISYHCGGPLKKIVIPFFLSVFLLSGCAAENSENSKNKLEGSQKPGNEQANERFQKSVALRERMLFEMLSAEIISEDESYISLRISYKLNSATQFKAFSVPVKKGQLFFQDMSNWLSTLEIREQTRVEFVLERRESNSDKQTLILGIQLRRPHRDKEKVSQSLIVLNFLENSNSSLVSIAKQKFEYPAKTEFRKWSNENRE
jgi:hypothetical protein